MTRAAAPVLTGSGDAATLDGEVAFVPDVVGADLLVIVAVERDGDGDGAPVAAVVDARAEGVSIEATTRYDATRPLGHVRLSRARGERLVLEPDVLADAWYLAHTLIAADSLGATQTCLDRSVQYAKERFTFGRAIGSYQAVKHELVEILRRLENGRGLQYYAGWAYGQGPRPPESEFPLAASAARSAAGEALDFATRTMINVHGGIGATWEHDAPLFFRRAELSRRLLGGTRDATDRVAERTLAGAVA
jgi:alkylation response protein AidB-like acyl-CoA dehydrogenase